MERPSLESRSTWDREIKSVVMDIFLIIIIFLLYSLWPSTSLVWQVRRTDSLFKWNVMCMDGLHSNVLPSRSVSALSRANFSYFLESHVLLKLSPPPRSSCRTEYNVVLNCCSHRVCHTHIILRRACHGSLSLCIEDTVQCAVRGAVADDGRGPFCHAHLGIDLWALLETGNHSFFEKRDWFPV